MLKDPLFERSASKFRTLIGSYRRRIATKKRNAVQNVRHLNACSAECNGDRQSFLREIIHTGKALNPAAAAEFIHDKIHRPGQVRCILAQKRKAPSRQPFTTPSVFYAQASDKCGKLACD
jgi:hypothetical protein